MARRARRRTGRGAVPIAGHQDADTEGAERYMWAFPDNDEVILSIPGLRDLRLTIPEAREVGEMLIEIADDTLRRQNNNKEVGD